VRTYYAELGQDNAQAVIDQVTENYENVEENGLSHQYGFNNGIPLTTPYPSDIFGAQPFPTMGQPTMLPHPHSSAVFLPYMAMAPGQLQPPLYGPAPIVHGPSIGTGSAVSPSLFQGQPSYQVPHLQTPPPAMAPFVRPQMAAPGSVTHLSSEIKAMRL